MAVDCDIVLRGGHIIDPRNAVDGIRDVAVRDGRIAAVDTRVDVAPGTVSVDVSGLYVFPGLVDIHTHVFGGYAGWLFPDQHALPYGVTTVVDAGGAGWRDMDRFRKSIVEPSTARVLGFVNIVGAGMTGPPEQNIEEMDVASCAAAVRDNADIAVGTKAAHFGGPGWESAGGAIQAARESDSMAMIDFAPKPTRSYAELLERMGPGDIHTHMYAAHIPLLDREARIQDYVWAARERGVVFDTGHGGGSFWFRIAVPAVRQGFPPDTVSTDLHKSSRLMADAIMPTTMSKYMAMGMTLQEAVYRSTQRPAEVLHRPELGHLTPGAAADVAVFALREEPCGFVDSGRARLAADRRLECEMTLRDGTTVWDRNGRGRPDWEVSGEYRRLD